jgi:hypothetical protein
MGRMSDDGTGAPLSRRVPGSNRSGPKQSIRQKLTDSTVNRIQAAIDAEHANTEMPLQREPSTEPLPRVTESGPPGKQAEKALRTEEALRATKALRAEEERQAAEELRAAEAPRATGRLRGAQSPRAGQRRRAEGPVSAA